MASNCPVSNYHQVQRDITHSTLCHVVPNKIWRNIQSTCMFGKRPSLSTACLSFQHLLLCREPDGGVVEVDVVSSLICELR